MCFQIPIGKKVEFVKNGLHTFNLTQRAFKGVTILCLVVVFLFLPVLSEGENDYTLQYASIESGGAFTRIAFYEFVDLVKNKGVEENVQRSASYTIETLTGYRESFTSVPDWMFF